MFENKHSGRYPWGNNKDLPLEKRMDKLEENLIRLAEKVRDLQIDIESLKREVAEVEQK